MTRSGGRQAKLTYQVVLGYFLSQNRSTCSNPSARQITRREDIEMLSQIRIYTINKGEMDVFLKHFKEEVMAVHERIGVPIAGTWVNRPQNEFIWVRNYADKADLEAKGKAFQAEVAKSGIKLGTNVAKMEVREVEVAFAPPAKS